MEVRRRKLLLIVSICSVIMVMSFFVWILGYDNHRLDVGPPVKPSFNDTNDDEIEVSSSALEASDDPSLTVMPVSEIHPLQDVPVVFDLRNVAIKDGRIVFHGEVDANDYKSFEEDFPIPRHFGGGRILEDADFRPRWDHSKLNLSDCVSYEEDTAVITAPFHTNNAFHTHNDNIIPMFTILEGMNMMESLSDVVVYFFADLQNIPETAYNLMFRTKFFPKRKDFEVMRHGGPYCFKQLVWGRGFSLFYHVEHVANRCIGAPLASKYRDFVYNLYGLGLESQEPAVSSLGATPRVLVLTRGRRDGRFVSNWNSLVEKFKSKGVSVSICCDWGPLVSQHETEFPKFLKLLSEVDVLIGIHGAALVNSLYMHRRSIMIELKGQHGWENPVMRHVAAQRQQMHLECLITQFGSSSNGHLLPNDFMDHIVETTLDGWKIQLERDTKSLEEIRDPCPRNPIKAANLTHFDNAFCYLP